jgi:DedD protein
MAKRSSNGGGALDPALPQKKRARRRLIGAAALALAAAIALSVLLDSEPRQQYADVEVEFPPRATPVQPPVPAESTSSAPRMSVDPGTPEGAAINPAHPQTSPGESRAAQAPAAAAPSPSAAAAGGPAITTPVPAPGTTNAAPSVRHGGSRTVATASAEASAGAMPDGTQGERTAPRGKSPADASKRTSERTTERTSSGGTVERGGSADRGSSANRSAPASAPPASAPPPELARPGTVPAERPVALQIGAFARSDSAQAMMERARKAGVRAYTESVRTSSGERTRVRVGPFATREAAERAQGKLKIVGIESSLVPLQP